MGIEIIDFKLLSHGVIHVDAALCGQHIPLHAGGTGKQQVNERCHVTNGDVLVAIYICCQQIDE